MLLKKLLLIALAGGLGSLARYGLTGLVQNLAGRDFPWGTVVVNVVGCLMFGVLWASMEGRFTVSGETRAIILVGFMGAFTTFSTYIFETANFLQDQQWVEALGNLAIQNVVGMAALLLGILIGRFV
jgi:CrcB protein